MAKWYFKSMGSEVGPLSNPELLDKVRSGEVTPETHVRKDDSKWFLARTVGGLFEQADRATQQVCPYCGNIVESVPAKCASCGRYVTATVAHKDSPERDAPKKHRSMAEVLAEETAVETDDPVVRASLLTFAGCFLLTLGFFLYMVIANKWDAVYWWLFGFSAIAMTAALVVGLIGRRRQIDRDLAHKDRSTE